MVKNNKLITSIKKSPFFYGSMLTYGEPWMLFILVLFFLIIMQAFFRGYYKLDIWIYLMIASGSLPVTVRFFIKPPNPFGEGWLQPRPTAMLSEEERKALTFLKTSKTLKKISLITGSILFFLIFIFPLLKLITHPNYHDYYSKTKFFGPLLALTFLYYVFSHLLFIFIIYHYVIIHWDEIQRLDITPWPKDKPYSTGPFRYRGTEEGSFISELLSIDPNTPFNWYDFLIISGVFLSIGLIFWGMGVIAILFNKIAILPFVLKMISFIAGIIILKISSGMWYKRHKKDK